MPNKVPPVDTSTEGWSKFVQATGAIFSNWTALKLATDNGWGGMNSKGKAQKMHQDALALFANGGEPVYADELGDFFEDTILDSFSCDAEDGSCREVAEKIVQQFQLCVHQGDFTAANQLIQNAGAAARRALEMTGLRSYEAPTTVETSVPALQGGCPRDPALGGGAGALERKPPTASQSTSSATDGAKAANFATNTFWATPMPTFDDDPLLNKLSPKAVAKSAESTSMDVADSSRHHGQGVRGQSPQRSGPVVDADGFEVVTRRKGRRGRR